MSSIVFHCEEEMIFIVAASTKHNERRNQEVHCKLVLAIASTHEVRNGCTFQMSIATQQQEKHNNKRAIKITQSAFSFVVQKENYNHCSMRKRRLAMIAILRQVIVRQN